MSKRNELMEGIGGNGNTVYMVVTINTETGEYLWIETFTRKAEALAWLRSSTY
jgi:hypothetical protein